MYYHVITVSCSNTAMKYLNAVEEVFLIPWGKSPILKGLPLERVHMEGNIIFVDNRKLVTCQYSMPDQISLLQSDFGHFWFPFLPALTDKE